MDPKEIYESLERGSVHDCRRESELAKVMAAYKKAADDGTLAALRQSNPGLAGLVEKLHEVAGLVIGTVSEEDLLRYHAFMVEKAKNDAMFAGAYSALMQDGTS